MDPTVKAMAKATGKATDKAKATGKVTATDKATGLMVPVIIAAVTTATAITLAMEKSE